MVGEKGMVEKSKGIVYDNESGMYFTKYFGDWWLVNDLDLKEATSVGVSQKDYEFYSNENKQLMAKRKEEAKKGSHAAPLTPPKALPPAKGAPPNEPIEPDWTGNMEMEPVGITQDIVRPIVSPEKVLAAFQQLQDIKKKLFSKDDVAEIGGRTFVRKSGLRKLKLCFNISMMLLREERRDLEGGHYEFTAYVRAKAPNGVFVDAISSCASNEPFGERQKESTRKLFPEKVRESKEVKPEMYVYAIRGMAQTRAFNRAISDLMGGGIDIMEEDDEKPNAP